MVLKELTILTLLALAANSEDFRNPHPNHRHSFMSTKELTDHWIGMPKSPYAHYTSSPVISTPRPTPAPTSAPLRPRTTTPRPPRRKSTNRRRHPDRMTDSSQKRRVDDEEDYDYEYEPPTYVEPPPPTPRKVFMSPSGSSSSMIFAGVPKVATYVVPSSKKYVVQRVSSQAMYVPPTVRRVDPLDYDDGANGGFLGPQNSFPPRAVMNKIAPAGQSQQPCHGPECHQHHKGLVRFYWRRLVYPPDSRRRRRRPAGQFRRRPGPRVRGRGGAAPSDIAETYTSDGGEEDDDDEDEDDDVSNRYRDEDDEENGEEGDDDSSRRRRWKPGRGYGHDWDEGSNYGSDNRMVYRDKRYAYRRGGTTNSFYGSKK